MAAITEKVSSPTILLLNGTMQSCFTDLLMLRYAEVLIFMDSPSAEEGP